MGRADVREGRELNKTKSITLCEQLPGEFQFTVTAFVKQ